MRLKNFVLAICSAAALLACSVSGSPLGQASQPSLTGPTTIPPTSGFGDPSTVVTLDAQGNMNWVGGAWYVPIPVAAGDVIGTVTATVRDNGAANGHTLDGNNVLAKLVSRTPTGDTTRAFWSSDGSGNRQTATLTPSGGYRVQVGDEMLVEFFGLTGGAIPGPSTVPSMTGPVTASPLALSTGSATRRFFPRFVTNSDYTAMAAPCFDVNSVGRLCHTSLYASSHGVSHVEIPFEPGESLVRLSVDVLGSTGGVATTGFNVIYASDHTQAFTFIASVPDSGRDGSTTPWSSFVVDIASPPVLGTESQLFLLLVSNGVGYGVGTISATFSKPL